MAEREEHQNPGDAVGAGSSKSAKSQRAAADARAADAQTDPGEALQEVEQAAETLQQEAEHAADAAADVAAAATASRLGGSAVNFPELTNGTTHAGADRGLAMLSDVSLRVKIELGRTRMFVEDVLHLNEHSVVELDKAAGDPVDIYVNDRHVARGEVLVVNENFCVRVSEIIKQPTIEEGEEH